MIRSTNWAKSVVVLVLTLFFGGALCAQIDKATISGTVTDESGAVVPNVRVTATNVETGVRYAAQSNDSGIYRIAALPIGDYSLDFEKSGFKKLSRTGLNVATGQVAEIDVQMLIGGVAEVVQVNSDNVLLETETTSVGTLMTASALKGASAGIGQRYTDREAAVGTRRRMAARNAALSGAFQSRWGSVTSVDRRTSRRTCWWTAWTPLPVCKASFRTSGWKPCRR